MTIINIDIVLKKRYLMIEFDLFNIDILSLNIHFIKLSKSYMTFIQVKYKFLLGFSYEVLKGERYLEFDLFFRRLKIKLKKKGA
jgi:hypothetical protein